MAYMALHDLSSYDFSILILLPSPNDSYQGTLGSLPILEKKNIKHIMVGLSN